ncbi:MAG: MBL fold metallo-hydrolase [Proteobacteria bacterium]|nr:MBL fold metallo-hydrolase [Pseudomonadota bacterium]
MKLTILGCGTSTGVPIIGCQCATCLSTEPKNSRTRASVLIETNGPEGSNNKQNLLIDTSTDLRTQALRAGLSRVDAVLYTHPHADHIHGIDDLRAFNMRQDGAIECFGSERTITQIRSSFSYIFSEGYNQSWTPNLTTTIVDAPFRAAGVEVIPIEIFHGKATIYGYRIGDAAYLTDCSGLPEESIEKLQGLKLLILGALRHAPHPTHMTVKEAVEASAILAPERTVLTHLGHNLEYATENSALPRGIELAYDTMEIEL